MMRNSKFFSPNLPFAIGLKPSFECRKRAILLKRIFALLAILLTLGFTQTSDTVATVNGVPISLSAFQQRIRFTRWTIGQQLLQVMQQSGEKALTDPTSPY